MNFTELEVLYKSIIIGFTLVIPVGPIAILLINRTVSNGKISGIASGVGVGLADALYAGIAAFGVSIVSTFLTTNEHTVRFIAGFVIIALGLRIFFSQPIAHNKHISAQTIIKDIVSIFLLTLANPLTLFAFFSALAVVHIHNNSITSAFVVACGVFLGSFAWWNILVNFVGIFNKIISSHKMKLFNTFSGIVIMLFGLIILGESILTILK